MDQLKLPFPEPRPDDLLQQLVRLRSEGLTYREIGARLGESAAWAWRHLNRSRYNDFVKESNARYRKRGMVPLVDYNRRNHQ